MISNDRNHIISVARFMKEYCIEKKYDSTYCEEMFTLGYLHDIGYEFCDNPEHNYIGGELLDKQKYKYSNEIKYHGVPDCIYSSKELDLLNFADMHIDGKGNYVSFEQRLFDIGRRRGKDSSAYKNSKKIIESLISKGYN